MSNKYLEWIQAVEHVAEEIGAPKPDISLKSKGYESNGYEFVISFYPVSEITGSDLGLEIFRDKINRLIPGATNTDTTKSTINTPNPVTVGGVYTGNLMELINDLNDNGYYIGSSTINLTHKPSHDKI